MQVPAVARARNIICATIGSLPLEVRRESNNSKVPTPPFIRQPDPRMTGQSVYTFLPEDILFTILLPFCNPYMDLRDKCICLNLFRQVRARRVVYLRSQLVAH